MNDEYSVNDRIIQLISEFGLTNAEFAQKIGVSASSISQLKAHRNKPGIDVLQGLLSVFKDIDANWLLTGVKSTKTTTVVAPEMDDIAELFPESTYNIVSSPKSEVFDEKKSPIVSPKRKQIEKIVTFYTDKTFSESYPE